MRQAGDDRHGHRLTAQIVVLWRAGQRIQEALSSMDAWAGSAIGPWLADRAGRTSGPCSE
jgi:hypothetical protein